MTFMMIIIELKMVSMLKTASLISFKTVSFLRGWENFEKLVDGIITHRKSVKDMLELEIMSKLNM